MKSDKGIRILHLYPNLKPACGITRTIQLITNGLDSGFSHFVACYEFDENVKNSIKYDKICHLLNHKIFILKILSDIYLIWNFVRNNKIDILHSYHRHFSILSFIISKFSNNKTVISAQSIVHNHRKISYLSENIIACSEFMKKHLNGYFRIPDSKISVIYNMVSPQEFHAPKVIDARKSIYTVGFVGRIDFTEKGIDTLIDLIRLKYAVTNNQAIRFMLIGDGVDFGILKTRIDEHKLPIELIKETTQVRQYYELFDLFILPSKIEPFGIVLLEAGMMGIPVIARRTGGIPEIIEDGLSGFLYETNEELFTKIEMLRFDSQLVRRLTSTLRLRILDKFSSTRILPQYKAYYGKVMQQ